LLIAQKALTMNYESLTYICERDLVLKMHLNLLLSTSTSWFLFIVNSVTYELRLSISQSTGVGRCNLMRLHRLGWDSLHDGTTLSPMEVLNETV
jgi:hypothetical protein